MARAHPSAGAEFSAAVATEGGSLRQEPGPITGADDESAAPVVIDVEATPVAQQDEDVSGTVALRSDDMGGSSSEILLGGGPASRPDIGLLGGRRDSRFAGRRRDAPDGSRVTFKSPRTEAVGKGVSPTMSRHRSWHRNVPDGDDVPSRDTGPPHEAVAVAPSERSTESVRQSPPPGAPVEAPRESDKESPRDSDRGAQVPMTQIGAPKSSAHTLQAQKTSAHRPEAQKSSARMLEAQVPVTQIGAQSPQQQTDVYPEASLSGGRKARLFSFLASK